MNMLFAAAATFLGVHLLVSGTPLRGAIVQVTGENIYLGLFSMASLAAIAWLCYAYDLASAGAENSVLFYLGEGIRDAAIPVVAVAFALGIPGVLMSNPTNPRQKKSAIRGVLRITRHPFLWGTAVWAGYHVLATGTLAAVVFFGTFLLVALIGTRAIDAKSRRRLGAGWQAIAAQTSNVPFAAILAGRNRLVAREYFDWRFVAAAAIFAGFLFFHSRLFSVSAFPAG